MYVSHVFVTALAASSTAQGFNIADEAQSAVIHTKRTVRTMLSWLTNMMSNNGPKKEEGTCPAVWSEISTTLTAQFLADGQCTDAARAAIRASFHDCFNGACDGSLILANECSNFENRGLERLCGNLGNLANEKEVGVADLIQFAAAHAVKTCPGGPTIPVKIGRSDSDQANALGVLPGPRAESGDLIKLFGEHYIFNLDETHTDNPYQHPRASPQLISPPSLARTPPQSNVSPIPLKQVPHSTQLSVHGTTSSTPKPRTEKHLSLCQRTRASLKIPSLQFPSVALQSARAHGTLHSSAQ
jgi:hypothetical protein